MQNINVASGLASTVLASSATHRRTWISALAFGLVGCFALGWGGVSAATSADSRGSAGTVLGIDVSEFAIGCELGDAVACNDLGVTHLEGLAGDADTAAALQLFERACSGGVADGCNNLGALYARGQAVPRDATRARELFTLACEAGSSVGCSNLDRDL